MGSVIGRLGIALTAVAVLGAGCVSLGVDSYEEFEGAVEAGASCDELFDIRDGFAAGRDRDRIDADLEAIGCETRDSARDEL